METALPMACTLSAVDLTARMEKLRALGRDGLVSSATNGREAVLRFRSAPDIRGRVEAAIAAESECCAFLDFRVDHGESGSFVTISAPEGGAPAVEQLAAALSGP